jgi:hypothetical protein
VDDDYVAVLLAILTNTEPTGVDPDDPYGQADDGIDRFDGFGRDVLVESLETTAGRHGMDLAVRFRLVLPPGTTRRRIPARGVVHLPFDPEWRRLSGYSDPAAYAPEVADRVMRAAHDHVVRHREGRNRVDERDRIRAALPGRDVQWQLLVDALGREGRVVEASPGRLEVQIGDDDADEQSDVVTVLVTPDEWEEVLAFRARHDPDLYVAELIAPRDDDEGFVVFYEGDLVRSTREALPPVRGRANDRRLAGLRATHPGAEVGWYAHRVEEPHKPEPPGG